jgi:hypothetical protein
VLLVDGNRPSTPSTGTSGGILSRIKKDKYDIIEVEENEILVLAEVHDKQQKRNLMLVIMDWHKMIKKTVPN